MDLSKAKVLITGGSSGIGKETARQLIMKGAKVVICARQEARLQSAAKEIGAIPIRADVKDEDEIKALVSQAEHQMGGYNVLINNAAYGYFSPLTKVDLESLNDMIATNIIGTILVARESAKIFENQKYGNIINIGSTAGKKGFAGGTPYAASKFAINGLTECWRSELRSHNIRVMQVNPSEVVTNFAANAGHGQDDNPSKLRPEDIAHVILNLLEMNDRGFVTDATIWATNPK